MLTNMTRAMLIRIHVNGAVATTSANAVDKPTAHMRAIELLSTMGLVKSVWTKGAHTLLVHCTPVGTALASQYASRI